MGEEKKFKARVQNKRKTEAEWYLDVYDGEGNLREDAFIPLKGELIIFAADWSEANPEGNKYDRFKFGDGVTNVIDLSFADEKIIEEMKANYLPRMEVIDQQRIDAGNPVDEETYNTYKKTYTRFYTERSWRDTDGDGVLEPRGAYGKVSLTPRGLPESLPHNFDEGETDDILDSVPQRLGSSVNDPALLGHILVNPDLPDKNTGMYPEVATPKKYVDEKITNKTTETLSAAKQYTNNYTISKKPMSSESYYQYNTVYENRYMGKDDAGNVKNETKLRYISEDYLNEPGNTQVHIPLRKPDGTLLVKETPVDNREATSKKYVDDHTNDKVSRIESTSDNLVYVEKQHDGGIGSLPVRSGVSIYSNSNATVYNFEDDNYTEDTTSKILNQLFFDSGIRVESNGSGNLSNQLASVKTDDIRGNYLNIYSDKRATAAEGTTERSHSVQIPAPEMLNSNANVAILEFDMCAAGDDDCEIQLKFVDDALKAIQLGREIEKNILSKEAEWVTVRLEAYFVEQVIQVYCNNRYITTLTSAGGKEFVPSDFTNLNLVRFNSYNASGKVDFSLDNISFYHTNKTFEANPPSDEDECEIPLKRVSDQTIRCETPEDSADNIVANVGYVKTQVSNTTANYFPRMHTMDEEDGHNREYYIKNPQTNEDGSFPTVIDTQIEIPAGKYIMVRAVPADDSGLYKSDWSYIDLTGYIEPPILVAWEGALETPKVNVDGTIATWNSIENAIYYECLIGDRTRYNNNNGSFANTYNRLMAEMSRGRGPYTRYTLTQNPSGPLDPDPADYARGVRMDSVVQRLGNNGMKNPEWDGHIKVPLEIEKSTDGTTYYKQFATSKNYVDNKIKTVIQKVQTENTEEVEFIEGNGYYALKYPNSIYTYDVAPSATQMKTDSKANAPIDVSTGKAVVTRKLTTYGLTLTIYPTDVTMTTGNKLIFETDFTLNAADSSNYSDSWCGTFNVYALNDASTSYKLWGDGTGTNKGTRFFLNHTTTGYSINTAAGSSKEDATQGEMIHLRFEQIGKKVRLYINNVLKVEGTANSSTPDTLTNIEKFILSFRSNTTCQVTLDNTFFGMTTVEDEDFGIGYIEAFEVCNAEGEISTLSEEDTTTVAASRNYIDTKVSEIKTYIDDSIEENSIIDVDSLPTENINEKALYRLFTATFIHNRHVVDNSKCYVVDKRPEIGEPATNLERTTITAYYDLSDGKVYGYLDETLAAGFTQLAGTTIVAGWYPAEQLLPIAGWAYDGVITNIGDDPNDSTIRLLLETKIYFYQNGWIELTNSIVDEKLPTPVRDGHFAYTVQRRDGKDSYELHLISHAINDLYPYQIPLRENGIIKTKAPVEGLDVANKNYVDTKNTEMKSYVDAALGDVVAALDAINTQINTFKGEE